MIIRDIIEEHADEVAALWMLRNVAVKAPHYSLDDLAELDQRLAAHISGLLLGNEEAWKCCATALETPASGEVFAAASVAFKTANPARISEVLSAVNTAPDSRGGLVSALGWLEKAEIKTLAKRLLRSKSVLQLYAGIAGCVVHRINPGKALSAAVSAEDPLLRARALRAVGELGRLDLQPDLSEHFASDEPACRFWAAWSATLLGERNRALQVLAEFATGDSPFMRAALQLLARTMSPADARKLFNAVARQNGELHAVAAAAGATGDPAYLTWLIKQMRSTALARAAAEAFTLITGLDLAEHDMEAEEPEDFEDEPDDEATAGGIGMDDDEDLPWPDTGKVEAWWGHNEGRFAHGQRLLLGQPVNVATCRQVLNRGLQRQRAAAALELALMHPETALYETRAPGFRQVPL